MSVNDVVKMIYILQKKDTNW